MESATDKYALTSIVGATGELHAWHSTDGNPRRTQSACHAASSAVVTSLYDGARVVAAAQNKGGSTTFVTYDLSRTSGGPAARCGGPETTMTSLSASPCSGFLAAGGSTGRLYVWHYASGRMLASLDAHLGAVTRLAWSAESSIVLSAGADGTVHAWSIANVTDLNRNRSDALRPSTTLRAHSLPVKALAVGAGLTACARVITAAADRSARLWHLGSGRSIGRIELPCAAVAVALPLLESECYIALANGDVLVVAFDSLPVDVPIAHTGMPVLRAPPAGDGKDPTPVSALAISPMGNEIIVGYEDGVVRIFDSASRMLVHAYRRHNTAHPVTALLVAFPMPPALDDTAIASGNNALNENELFGLEAGRVAHEAVTIAPPTLAKAEMGDEDFVVSLELQAESDCISEAWAAIENAPYWEDDVKQISNVLIPKEIEEEMAMLRRRNQELEEAGTALCNMVQTLTQR